MDYFLPHEQIASLLSELHDLGYQVIGPQVHDGAIIYQELDNAAQLPWGVVDHQQPGSYRLEQTTDNKAFRFNHGPQAIKPLLFKPSETLFKTQKTEDGRIVFTEVAPAITKTAVLGVRACDIAGMRVQDKVFTQGQYQNHSYQKRREALCLIAVNCTRSGNQCFCVSTQTGPQVTELADIILTEITDGFVVQQGSELGQKIIAACQLELASEQQLQDARQGIDQAIATQQQSGKKMPKNNSRELRDILFSSLDHPRWDEVASRCLSCGNCTMVCPTCFCHKEQEQPELDLTTSYHVHEWDSCFTKGHSYIHNQTIRKDTKSRYKQWLTHKLGSWWDQFDESGCIGCGRCVTWCPVGIDIVEEMTAIIGDEND